MVAMTPAGFTAMLAGWTVTEVGRQPWTVYGVMRTAQSASPRIQWTAVAWSFGITAVIYFAMFAAGLYFLLPFAVKEPGVFGVMAPEKGA
jgi:cytochrome d ubiquinol oxidase subunit I